jgi:hypothetical protein
MRSYIPGHARAFTWILLVITGCVAYGFKNELNAVVGIFLIISGAFIGDQATHLAQMDHKEGSLTWIERQLQRHRWASVIIGLFISALGTAIVV